MHDLPLFVGHREPSVDGQPQYRARAILDGLPVQTAPGPYLPCLAVRVLWDIPVWPVWQLTGWVVDPHYLVVLPCEVVSAAGGGLAVQGGVGSVVVVVVEPGLVGDLAPLGPPLRAFLPSSALEVLRSAP